MSKDKKLSIKYHKENLIELKPYGLAAGLEVGRPVLIFRSTCEKHSVGVPLSPLEAGISVAQNHYAGVTSSPHGLALKTLKAFGARPVRCIFKEVRGHFLYVDVEFDGSEKITRIESRADEAISFCIRSGVSFFASLEVIQMCKQLEAFNLHETDGQQATLRLFGQVKNKHPYLM